ncbi:MAG: multidrug efflux pump subunit AcrB [Phenylobacterium sp.]|jgi:multidrug efflux pump subunit AcrB
MWLKQLIQNHVLTNLVFVLILAIGIFTYQQMPRERDPSVNFNWVQITTLSAGVSSTDIERKVTDVIEEAIEKIQDIKFVSSTSREGVSSILVRFNDIGTPTFDKRLADLRREVNNIEDQLPDDSKRPLITEITTANAFPSASVVITGISDDENLHRQARALEKDLARLSGVDRVRATGLREPEIQIQFDLAKTQSLGLSPVDIADTIRAYYSDIAAGTVRIAKEKWTIRVQGETTDPQVLAQLPILNTTGQEIRLFEVAKVISTRSKATQLTRFNGKPAVLFAVMKQSGVNTLALVEDINQFIIERNRFAAQLGVSFALADDQTEMTRNALNIMQTNASYGLILVLLVTWLFLGSKISVLVTIGIPFTLAGTFIVLNLLGQTLNTSVLLAIVISLGMLVDDAVVVVESIHHKLRYGGKGIKAVWGGLREVISPVTSSVLTTMAAFLPLMLLPGILGKFMLVIPLVVTLALAISLIEAYWMLPSHLLGANVNFQRRSKFDDKRQHALHRLRVNYGKALVKILRNPKKTMATMVLLVAGAFSALAGGVIRMDFFAVDSVRIFYINIDMPPSSSLDSTVDKVLEIEHIARQHLQDDEIRSVVSYAGQAFTEMELVFGDHRGQIQVSLQPKGKDSRTVSEIVESIRANVSNVSGTSKLSFLTLAGGPPPSKPISVKVRGDDFTDIRAAADAMQAFMATDDRYQDVVDDDSIGSNGLTLSLNLDTINRLGINPTEIQRTIKMLVDGEVVSFTRHQGDKMTIKVISQDSVGHQLDSVEDLLTLAMPTRSGTSVPLRELVSLQTGQVKGNIRHYNFKRTITIEAEIDDLRIDTVAANQLLQDHWQQIAAQHPNVSLNFAGELDDIIESLDSIGLLFLLGVGIMYLILSTQFQSYFQPLMILVSVPLAFVGVILGLFVSNNPLSLFTMYGIVALAGIAVNTAIVLISKANTNLNNGMSLLHSIFFAARRRLLPVVITTLTTVAGLFSLAFGLGGDSLIWSPVATSIVWGLIFSSFLTLFIIPVLYLMVMRRSGGKGVKKSS